MYPRIVMDKNKIKHNTALITNKAKEQGIFSYAVTKSFCANKEIAQATLDGGAVAVADARIENLKNLQSLDCEKVLLRLPMLSQIEEVVNYADISLNSELVTIRKIDEVGKKLGKTHKIILMIDLGDLREGILPVDVDTTVEEILKLDHVILHGVGVNLTCYGGVIPDHDNLGQLVNIAKHIEEKYDVKLEVISGGNSSSLYLLEEGGLPEGINNLRPGEAIVLGRETKEGTLIKGAYDDAFILEAEIIELKEKDSLPKGEIGMDAFGNRPVFEDKGKMVRGIVGIGRQDVNPDSLTPITDEMTIIGASSDHMIIDLTNTKGQYKVGDILKFKLDYGSLLSLTTSEYVDTLII